MSTEEQLDLDLDVEGIVFDDAFESDSDGDVSEAAPQASRAEGEKKSKDVQTEPETVRMPRRETIDVAKVTDAAHWRRLCPDLHCGTSTQGDIEPAAMSESDLSNMVSADVSCFVRCLAKFSKQFHVLR
jgi:hypothetical protein